MALLILPGQDIHRDNTFLDYTADWTRFMWFKWGQGEATVDYRVVSFASRAAADYGAAYLGVYTGTLSSEELIVDLVDGLASAQTSAATILTPGNWYWVGLVYNSSAKTLKYYLSNTLVQTFAAVDWTGADLGLEFLGDDGDLNGKKMGLAYERVWQTQLTQTELVVESQSEYAVKQTGLLVQSPLDSLADLSNRPAGFLWTPTGSLDGQVVAGPLNAPGWAVRSTSAVATGTVSLTITKPTGTADGDIMVMSLAHKGAGFATVPAGWTLVQRALQGSTRGEMYWKRASGEGASYSVTGLATAARGVITSYTGGLATGDVVIASSVLGAAASTKTGTTSITTTVPCALLVTATASGANETSISIRNKDLADTIQGAEDDSSIQRYKQRAEGGTTGIFLNTSDMIKVVPEATGVIYNKLYPSGAALTGEHVTILAAFYPEPTIATTQSHFYLTLKRPEYFIGAHRGDWEFSLGNGPIAPDDDIYGEMLELSTRKSDAGAVRLKTLSRNSDTPSAGLLGRWCTRPLARQFIDGTVNLMNRVSIDRSDTSSGNPIPTAVYRLHVYITVGDSTTVRSTLLDKYVDGTNWTGTTTPTFQALAGAQTLTGGVAEEGDRVMVELGCRISVPTAYPTPSRPPTKAAVAKMSIGGTSGPTDNLYIAEVAVQDGTAASTSELAPYIDFSDALAELTYPEDTFTNLDCASAEVIATLPFSASIAHTRQVPKGNRRLWYTWTATEDMRVFFHVLGSSQNLEVVVFENCPATSYATVVTSSTNQQILSRAYVCLDAVAGQTYWIMARHRSGVNATGAPASGGNLVFSAFRKIPAANDDVFIISGGYIARYTKDGILADLSGDFGTTILSGVAIDYTKRPMDDLKGGTHADDRLYLGVFGLDYVEILDLKTLNLGEQEVDFISDPLDASRKNLYGISLNTDGTLAIGFSGDGYTYIANGANSTYLNTSALNNSARVNVVDATHADNQTGAPFAAALTRAVALDVSGSNHLRYLADGDNILYTSSGEYIPIGGQKIKRYNLSTGVQGADFATLSTGPGNVPGARGVFPLADGGCLVCNGAQVLRLDSVGAVVTTYTPTLADHVTYFADVEINSTGTVVWAIDAISLTLFKFDMATGAQLDAIVTNLAVSTVQMAVYRAAAATPLVVDTQTTQQWKLHRFDLKPRREETA